MFPIHLLGRFLNGAILLEGQQFTLYALQGVGQVTLLQLQRFLSNPTEQIRGQSFVVHFLAICVHQLAHNLKKKKKGDRLR